MTYMYVTSLYEVCNIENKVNIILENAQKILDLNVDLIIFVDPKLKNKLLEIKLNDKIKIIEVELTSMVTYQKIFSKDGIDLPKNLYIEKDTKGFISLMNLKVEFIKIANELFPNYDHYIWIDFGIYKIFKNKEYINGLLKNMKVPKVDKIIMPYILEKTTVNLENLKINPCWRFAGGFFICPKNKIEDFYNLFCKYIDYYLENNIIVWEVNIWAHIEMDYPDYFYTYKGQHDDTIILNYNDNIKDLIQKGEIEKAEIIVNDALIRNEKNIDDLLTLITFFRSIGDCKKAYKYYLISKYIERDQLYEELFLYESSIILFYVNKKEEGLENIINYFNLDCQKNYDNVLSNLYYYIKKLKDYGESFEYNFPDLSDKNISNYFFASSPTILKLKNGNMLLNVRYVCYKLDQNANYWTPEYKNNDCLLRTRNVIYFLDENYKPKEGPYYIEEKVDDLSTLDSTNIYGLEDIRIFYIGDQLHYLATSREFTTTNQIIYGKYPNIETSLTDLKLKDNKILKFPFQYKCEKNWIPIVRDDKLYIIYSWYPLLIGDLNNDTFVPKYQISTPRFFKHFRGSSSFIKYDNLYYGVAHFVRETKPRKYHHCIVVLNNDFNLVKYSEPFYFCNYSVEYCLGFLMTEQDYIFTFSQFDRNSTYLKCPINTIKFFNTINFESKPTITIKLRGRLGNQLFQYAAVRNIAYKKGYNIYFDPNFIFHGQKCMLESFNIDYTDKSCVIDKYYNQPNNSFDFDVNFLNISNNTLIEGHFENEKYFEEIEHIIKKELTIKDNNVINFCNNYMDNLKEGGYKIIGIHFRRGDVLSQCGVDFVNKLTIDYSLKCLDLIKEKESKLKIIVFTGGVRPVHDNSPCWSRFYNNHNDDVDWLKNFKYNDIEILISPGTLENNILVDYHLLTMCDYVILTIPSTFGWMASYVNKSENIYYNTQYNSQLKPAKKFKILN